ncbi:LysR substrate-binding domain-containing protein [Nocardioides sp. LHG3406-4]|uniref:LysR substrate-binding domain-containing protein n=1 Tax=Nocardioides sp. LHG3406-4 TaxID=2804575 RepID=UPI003CE8F972
MSDVLRVAFVTGSAPDKWAARWRERSRTRLALTMVEESEQRRVLDDDTADMVIARLPIDETDLHVVRLYEELPVAVVSREHPAAAYDELPVADLLDEQFVLGPPAGMTPVSDQLDFPPMSQRDAVEVAASGSGVVVLPMSVARLLQRKDVAHVVLTDLPSTQIALVWKRDRDDDDTQAFVGVVKGRTSRSSR